MRAHRFLTAMAVLALAAACTGGGQTSPTPGGATEAPGPTATSSLEGMTLTLWSSTGIASPVQNVWRNFEKETGATIDYIAIPDPFEDSLMAKWVGGDRPDILMFHAASIWLQRLQAEQNLVDLSGEDFVARTKFDLYDYTGTVDGKVYAAFTLFPSVSGVFYNRDVFSTLGLDLPADWAALIEMCRTIRASDASVTPIAAGGGAMWPLQFIAAAYLSDEVKDGLEKEINDGTVKLTDARITAAHQALLDMRDAGCFEDDLATSQYEDQVSRVFDGSAAMAFQGAFMIDDMNDSYGADAVNAKIGYFPVSARGKLAFWTVGQTGTYEVPVNPDPAKQAAALEFVRFATSAGYQAYLDESGDIPVLEDFDPPASLSPIKKELNDFLEGGAVQFFGSSLKYPRGPWHVFLNEMLTDQKSPEDVGAAMQEAWDTAAAAGG